MAYHPTGWWRCWRFVPSPIIKCTFTTLHLFVTLLKTTNISRILLKPHYISKNVASQKKKSLLLKISFGFSLSLELFALHTSQYIFHWSIRLWYRWKALRYKGTENFNDRVRGPPNVLYCRPKLTDREKI